MKATMAKAAARPPTATHIIRFGPDFFGSAVGWIRWKSAAGGGRAGLAGIAVTPATESLNGAVDAAMTVAAAAAGVAAGGGGGGGGMTFTGAVSCVWKPARTGGASSATGRSDRPGSCTLRSALRNAPAVWKRFCGSLLSDIRMISLTAGGRLLLISMGGTGLRARWALMMANLL